MIFTSNNHQDKNDGSTNSLSVKIISFNEDGIISEKINRIANWVHDSTCGGVNNDVGLLLWLFSNSISITLFFSLLKWCF